MRLRDRLQKAGQQTSGRGSRCKEVGSAVTIRRSVSPLLTRTAMS